jgi:hypothetical protein
MAQGILARFPNLGRGPDTSANQKFPYQVVVGGAAACSPPGRSYQLCKASMGEQALAHHRGALYHAP